MRTPKEEKQLSELVAKYHDLTKQIKKLERARDKCRAKTIALLEKGPCTEDDLRRHGGKPFDPSGQSR